LTEQFLDILWIKLNKVPEAPEAPEVPEVSYYQVNQQFNNLTI